MLTLAWETLLLGAERLAVNRAFRAIHQGDLLILNYHGVVPDEYARNRELYGNVVGISEFSRQMSELTRFFRPIGISELRDWQTEPHRAPLNPVLVTFDDGYRNNLTCAVPVLRRLGIPALVSICTGYVGRKRILWPDEVYLRVLHWPEPAIHLPCSAQMRPIPDEFSARRNLAAHIREFCKRIPSAELARFLSWLRKHPMPEVQDEIYGFLSWEEVRTLKRLGFEIGSHTVEHSILRGLPPEDMVREIRESKRVIEEQIGGECACFVYPNGGPLDISLEAVQEVRRAGYRFAFTVMGRLASLSDDPLLLDRVFIPAGSSTAGFQGRISGLHAALKSCTGAGRRLADRSKVAQSSIVRCMQEPPLWRWAYAGTQIR